MPLTFHKAFQKKQNGNVSSRRYILGPKSAKEYICALNEKLPKIVWKHPNGAFPARKMLQKSRYSVMGQMGALFSNLRPLLSKTIHFEYNVKNQI